MNENNIESNQVISDPNSNPQLVSTLPSPERNIGRFKASFIVTKESWALLKKDKEMLAFPILSLVIFLSIIAIAGIITFFLILGGNVENIKKIEQGNYWLEFLVIFLFYFIMVFVSIFFEAGIVTVVRGRLNDQNLTFLDGLKNSFRKSGKIAKWALIAATVGVILSIISERSKSLGKIIVYIFGTAWSILTFFVAPILIIEDLSIKESLQKSGNTIKKVWGETVIIDLGTNMFFSILILAGVLIFFALIFTLNMKIIFASGLLLFLYIVILVLISSTLSVIYRVVLYEYANTGIVPQGFSKEAIGFAFKQEKVKA